MRPRFAAALQIVSIVASIASCGAPTAPGSVPALPSETPVAAIDLVADGGWRALPDPARLQISKVEQTIAVPGGFVATGCTSVSDTACGVPAIWTSADAVAWSGPNLLPVDELKGETYGVAKAAALLPIGLAVGGYVRHGDRTHAALWFSPDLRTFERVPDDASFSDAAVLALVSAGDQFVAVGSGAFMEFFGFRAWSSDDGKAWISTATASDEASPVGLLASNERDLIAWGRTCGVCPAETAWWRSEDGLAWTATGIELANDRFAVVTAVGEGHTGLVAFGETGIDPVKPAAWSLGSGADRWEHIQPPVQPHGAPIRHYLRVGEIAVLATTSLRNPSSPTGLVWRSSPGDEAWRPEIEVPGMEVIALLEDPARLDHFVVVGRPPDGATERFLWTGTVDLAQ